MRIGYYFGAGISKESIPLALDLPTRLAYLANALELKFKFPEEMFDDAGDYIYGKKVSNLSKEMFADWREIAEECRGIPIDTYAIENKDQPKVLAKIKNVISSYFLVEQSLDHSANIEEYDSKISPRIRNFLSQLIKSVDSPTQLFNNPIIFSWNYDNQFELSFCKHIKSIYADEHKFRYALKLLNIIPGNENFDTDIIDIENTHTIIKLNGSAGYLVPTDTYRKWNHYGQYLAYQNTEEMILRAIRHYGILKYSNLKIKNYIRFAFEKNGTINTYQRFVKDAASKIERLVVMGYSFPSDNNQIDSEVFESMTNIKEAILVDLSGRENILLERFKNRMKKDIAVRFSSNVGEIPVY
ncbi:hypothetical protein [Leptospira santarosai]|uniref:SIR2-like domain protein n=1 Tax=Leptospira santarosai str. ZUN179 TaxID=1049985 RepID=M6UQ52_9LEPT|nr:hypothetical protein [Leptospira santarosai]AVV78740.1 Uncharacterized protein XB15_00951 [Leptospira santarosai]EMO47272.1 hypothetical protein LEP1GSC187_0006 [Leptospira santarosai str. ZUN179]EMO86168.1 hypothetical protein LEP1GSC070_0476 [Leptospira santarosai str. AIM]OLY63621.1 hypothetical protein BWD11_13280 [Leptospira santarosai serovar Grippotyphosa]ONF76694.1 hypothetical protein BWD12_17865 [Leptospira santarosai serovar Bananal]